MKRLLAFALMVSLGNVPSVFAGGSLLQSGSRHVQEMAKATATAASPAPSAAAAATKAGAARPALQAGQPQPTLEGSGMRTRTKVMLAIGAGVAFAASVWAIDHHVVDVTPSSLGTRQD